MLFHLSIKKKALLSVHGIWAYVLSPAQREADSCEEEPHYTDLTYTEVHQPLTPKCWD